MSLLRYFLRQNRPRRFYDNHLGLSPVAEDALRAFIAPMVLREPWHYFDSNLKELDSTVKVDKNKFQINLDLKNFAPHEITVKTKDGHVIVEGKHEEREDEHSFTTRHFMRSYSLPEDCQTEAVESSLSEEGVLTVTAPRSAPSTDAERVVPIARKAEKQGDDSSEESRKK